jgi:RNA polymerase sigma factor (sigma-70 family)
MTPQLSPQPDPFTELWRRCMAGDKGAFGELAELSYTSLYHYGTKFTSDRELVKDCIQDLFLDFWEKRSQISGVFSPKSYLFQALRNNLIRRVKKEARFADMDAEHDDHFGVFSVETDWIVKETQEKRDEKLRQIIEKLPARQRHALYLRYYENLSYEEIAEVMGLRRQAVANYLQFGIQKLRQYWHHGVIFLIWLMIRSVN